MNTPTQIALIEHLDNRAKYYGLGIAKTRNINGMHRVYTTEVTPLVSVYSDHETNELLGISYSSDAETDIATQIYVDTESPEETERIKEIAERLFQNSLPHALVEDLTSWLGHADNENSVDIWTGSRWFLVDSFTFDDENENIIFTSVRGNDRILERDEWVAYKVRNRSRNTGEENPSPHDSNDSQNASENETLRNPCVEVLEQFQRDAGSSLSMLEIAAMLSNSDEEIQIKVEDEWATIDDIEDNGDSYVLTFMDDNTPYHVSADLRVEYRIAPQDDVVDSYQNDEEEVP